MRMASLPVEFPLAIPPHAQSFGVLIYRGQVRYPAEYEVS